MKTDLTFIQKNPSFKRNFIKEVSTNPLTFDNQKLKINPTDNGFFRETCKLQRKSSSLISIKVSPKNQILERKRAIKCFA